MINKTPIIKLVNALHECGESHIRQHTSTCRWKDQTLSIASVASRSSRIGASAAEMIINGQTENMALNGHVINGDGNKRTLNIEAKI